MELPSWDIEQAYRDMLDECHPVVNIAGNFYRTSSALKEIDPVAYRCGLADWTDAQLSDGVWFEHEDGTIHDVPEREVDDRDMDDNKKV